MTAAGAADVRSLEVGAHAARYDGSNLRPRRVLEDDEGTMLTKTLRPQPRAEVMAIDAYVPGKSAVAGLAKVHKLSSNESPLGPSPRAIEAFRASADQLASYPDGASRALARGDRPALRARLRADHLRQRLRRTAGLLAHVYLRPGDEGLYSQYGFLEYPIAIRAAGGVPVIGGGDAS